MHGARVDLDALSAFQEKTRDTAHNSTAARPLVGVSWPPRATIPTSGGVSWPPRATIPTSGGVFPPRLSHYTSNLCRTIELVLLNVDDLFTCTNRVLLLPQYWKTLLSTKAAVRGNRGTKNGVDRWQDAL
ncbi:hypothetical protein DUNSADRAFT_4257 [Dunaliella salina]|uniref:Encoded protein n=1 Tax=Dunaliella salina TaxID=3046 RepID=A0ABQ7GSF8_DUNSA|nr:hypothetical protein DUNSADRAFT_4257 [Dunaliella salina]|eukprot:KAF5837510.1 hypothetical protein DUNSADRAFT_4257 [Dunaliella salina]